MKIKAKFVLIIFSIFFFIFSLVCKKQKAEWIGEVGSENGVKVVKNPDESFFGELVFDLEEDLVIGNEEENNYMFYRVYDINVDSQGNIYVLDAGNHRMQKFDKNGDYLQTIGRKGQGPGEFTSPFDIVLDSQSNIYVSGMRKIQMFNFKGEFIKSFVVPIYLLGYTVNLEGNIVASGFISSKKGQNFGVVIIDSTGKIIKNISEFAGMSTVVRGDSAFSLTHDYSPVLNFSPVFKKGVVYGYSPEYKLILLDQNGNNYLIVKKDEPFLSISQKEKDKIINDAIEDTAQEGRKWPRDVVEEAANFPKHRPFFDRILSDDKGRIYVRKIKSVFEKNKQRKFDIFSQDGYYLYTTELPFTPRIIQNGFFYDIYSSEETGEVRIKRYKIKNWNQIKEGI